MSEDLAKLNAVVRACISNAEQLLSAAQDVRKPGRNHIAYHLAAMALEEIGKAEMITVSSLRSTPIGGGERRPVDWIEDHEKKLFWALWTPSFGRQPLTAEHFRQFQSLAKDIHESRLASLYVDPNRFSDQEPVSDQDLDTILRLTEARLNMEKVSELRPPDEATRKLIDWFFEASENPQLKPIIFSGGSQAKLLEVGGDAAKWVAWLHDSIDEMHRTNQELAQKELRRSEPTRDEQSEPKWQLKIRLRSWSHSVRPKPLAVWNQGVDWIKLFHTTDKKELLVQFTIPKSMPVQGVWPGGMEVCWLFVLALNIGTRGFFWWYLPTFVSKYYEELFDIENDANVIVERSPQLTVSWGPQALKDPELSNVSVVFTHLAHIRQSLREPYDQYFRALGLLAKNDIFGQFESVIFVNFCQALKAGLIAYSDWEAKAETLQAAVDRAFKEMGGDASFIDHLKELLQWADDLASRKPGAKIATLEEVIKLKVYCDAYFLIRARKELQERAQKHAAGSSEPSIEDSPKERPSGPSANQPLSWIAMP